MAQLQELFRASDRNSDGGLDEVGRPEEGDSCANAPTVGHSSNSCLQTSHRPSEFF